MKHEEMVKKFYSTFRIGIEVEGEFRQDIQNKRGWRNNMWEVGYDGSINKKKDGTYSHELRSSIISTKTMEESMLQALKNIEVEHGDGKSSFSIPNESCGTHIHLSFKKPGLDHRLYVLDTYQFEEYFFKRYFATFKLKKFRDRVRSEGYCKYTYNKDRKTGEGREKFASGLEVAQKKANLGRHVWMNTQCIIQNRGIEIRIYPYIQTAKGMESVIRFTQETILSYLGQRDVRAQMAKFDVAHMLRNKKIDIEKLGEVERAVLFAIGFRNTSMTPNTEYLRGDARLLLGTVMKRNLKFAVTQ